MQNLFVFILPGVLHWLWYLPSFFWLEDSRQCWIISRSDGYGWHSGNSHQELAYSAGLSWLLRLSIRWTWEGCCKSLRRRPTMFNKIFEMQLRTIKLTNSWMGDSHGATQGNNDTWVTKDSRVDFYSRVDFCFRQNLMPNSTLSTFSYVAETGYRCGFPTSA